MVDRIAQLEVEVERAKERAEYAASIALAGIETTKHFMRTVEAQHEALGEVIAATKKMVALNEKLARHALAEAESVPE